MRAVFWCDMEGVAGITKWDQVMAGAAQYEEGRRIYTEEINAAVRGAKKAGYKEIIVVDGHGAGGDYSFNSLIKDRLESGAEYVFGYRWGSYIEPLQAGCDAMLLPGAHAKAGTSDGILCHTMSSQNFYEVTINGKSVGESGIVAAIAASFQVPTIFASGDEATGHEVRDFIGPSIFYASVKKGLNRFAARSMAPKDACELIENMVCNALKSRDKWPKPLTFTSPIEMKVELASPDKTKDFIGRLGCEVVGPRTVISRGKTFWDVWNQFWYH